MESTINDNGQAARGDTRVRKTGADRVQHQAKDILITGDGYVRDRPWQAVGAAAAVGLFLGFLVARRASRP